MTICCIKAPKMFGAVLKLFVKNQEKVGDNIKK